MRPYQGHRPSSDGWRRWLRELDPSSPRAIDYVVGAVLLLVLALLYVGERNYAFQLNRRVFNLEERRVNLQGETDLLMSRAMGLADRQRITRIASQKLGMIAASPDGIEYIYFVPGEGQGCAEESEPLLAGSR